jgi:hypothetical protein
VRRKAKKKDKKEVEQESTLKLKEENLREEEAIIKNKVKGRVDRMKKRKKSMKDMVEGEKEA